jgi:3'-phosphoadenosine 5'-phosphosulfate sulfotransferase (PAPS reductase)/FAD synthetase
MDTGWEHPTIFKYLSDVLEPRFGKATVLKNAKYENGMVDAVKDHGYFPSRLSRYCTGYLKIEPSLKHIREIEDDVITVIGIRRGESQSRMAASRWDYDKASKSDVFRPLVNHSFDDVIQMHQEGNIEPNPLYLQGFNRVGCFPCIFAKKDEISRIATLWPERIDQIEGLENLLTNGNHEKYDRDPEFQEETRRKIFENIALRNKLEPLGVTPAELYRHNKGRELFSEEVKAVFDEEIERLKNEGESTKEFQDEKQRILLQTFFMHRASKNITIREAVDWSKTSRGGKQMQMFDLTAKDGCLRWGMCDSPLADEELLKISEPKR